MSKKFSKSRVIIFSMVQMMGIETYLNKYIFK